MNALDTPHGSFDEFKVELESLKKKLQPGYTAAGIMARSMTWDFSKDKTKHMIFAVERFKLRFNLVLTNENLCHLPTFDVKYVENGDCYLPYADHTSKAFKTIDRIRRG